MAAPVVAASATQAAAGDDIAVQGWLEQHDVGTGINHVLIGGNGEIVPIKLDGQQTAVVAILLAPSHGQRCAEQYRRWQRARWS